MEDRLEELEGPHAEKLKAELETIKKDQQAELIEHYEAVGTGIERALDKLEDDEKLDLDGAKRAIDTSIEYERKALAILRVVTRLGKKIKKLL
ncbi:hypothetical protein KY317_03935 [Candidatus Woesearchaeota archaeon]|nr:hypothetical protein [Candidatus Woesearchaeota archaeon]